MMKIATPPHQITAAIRIPGREPEAWLDDGASVVSEPPKSLDESVSGDRSMVDEDDWSAASGVVQDNIEEVYDKDTWRMFHRINAARHGVVSDHSATTREQASPSRQPADDAFDTKEVSFHDEGDDAMFFPLEL